MILKPNILFLIIDALPAYRCYGKNKTSKTPSIDSLIKKGICFEQAISSADFTPTSFGGIFTGIFPFRAAIRGGVMFYKLKPNVESYFKVLKKHGYYELATLPGLTSMQKLYSEFEKHNYSLFNDRLYNGLGNKIIDQIELLQKKEPWIYFIHLMDTHKPINYPKEYDEEKFGEDEYDRMISSIDKWIGKIIEKIDLKKTIVILSADHGDYIRSIKNNGKVINLEHKSLAGTTQMISKITPDLFYPLKIKLFLGLRNLIAKIKLRGLERELTPFEKRNLQYARSNPNHFLFDELIRVPLILAGYNIPADRKIQQQVRTVDIFPTVLELIGLPNLIKNVDGVSFVPLINGQEFFELPAYIETSINYKNSSEGGYGIRTSKYKYFRRIPEKDKQIHLYDLQNDPYEQDNVAVSHPEVIKKMEKKLFELKAQKVTSEKDFIKKRIQQKKNQLSLSK